MDDTTGKGSTVPSTLDTVKMVISLVFKIWNIAEFLARDKQFTDSVNELDSTITGLKNAKSTAERIDAAAKLIKFARGRL